MARKRLLLKRFGKALPAGMSSTDVEILLQFLYGAFDRRMAKIVQIQHPYWEDLGGEGEPPVLTVDEFSQWLQEAQA